MSLRPVRCSSISVARSHGTAWSTIRCRASKTPPDRRWRTNLYGDAGNNILDGGLGADLISGGGGIDTVNYGSSTRAVTVDLIAQTGSDGVDTDTLSSIENAIGSSLNDTFSSDALTNRFDGGGGTDTVSYVNSNTAVIIDLGGQITWDGTVNDTLSSIESAIGSSLNDTFYSNALANKFDGGGGSDTVSYAGSSKAVIVDLGGQITFDGAVNDTLSSIENAVGSGPQRYLLQQCQANRFDGGGGTDTVSYAGSSTGVIIDLIGQTTFDGTVNDTLSSIENAIGSSSERHVFQQCVGEQVRRRRRHRHRQLCRFQQGRNHRPDRPDRIGRHGQRHAVEHRERHRVVLRAIRFSAMRWRTGSKAAAAPRHGQLCRFERRGDHRSDRPDHI